MISNLPNMLTGAAVKVIGASMITVPKTAQNWETPQKDAVGSINQQHGPTGQVSPATS